MKANDSVQGDHPYSSRALSLLYLSGIILSGISLWHFVTLKLIPDAGPSFCNINATFNCDAVTTSKFGMFLGIPLGSYGLLYYILSWCFHLAALDSRRVSARAARDVQFFLASAATLLSIALFIVSEFVIGAVCLICVGMYLVNFGLFFATAGMDRSRGSIARLMQGIRSALKLPAVLGGKRSAAAPHAVGTAWLGVVLAGVVVVGILSLPATFYPFLLKMYPAAAVNPKGTIGPEGIIANWREQPAVEHDLNLEPGLQVDHAKGPPFAPVRIVEFLDFECPACRRLALAMHDIVVEYPDQIHLVLRNYPLDTECNPSMQRELHHNACYSALVARCAGEQGRFWDVAEYLFGLDEFDDGSEPKAVRAAIDQVSAAVGLDTAALKECLDSKRHLSKLLDDIREGNSLGLQSTPSVWINNHQLIRPTPASVRAVIAYILSNPEK